MKSFSVRANRLSMPHPAADAVVYGAIMTSHA